MTERQQLHQRRRQFGYDTGGRLASVSDSTYFDENVCTDPEDIMTCERQTGWNPAGDVAYTYDDVGNRTDSNARLYANTNRYRSLAGDSLVYDAEGNLTQRVQPGDDQFLYWNELGQLDSVVTGSTKVSYGYNGFGQRIKRTHGSSVTISIYDGDDLLLEANGSNTVLREYLHYPGIDVPHSVRIGSTTYFYAMEQPGHVVGLATGTGTVAQRYRYSAWGAAEQDSGAVTQPLRFMAREVDAVTGLYYVRNRWYGPGLARFVSEDPVGLAGGINAVTYTANNPANLRDPTGLECRANGNRMLCWSLQPRDWITMRDFLGGETGRSLFRLAVDMGWTTVWTTEAAPAHFAARGGPEEHLFYVGTEQDFVGCPAAFSHLERQGTFVGIWSMYSTTPILQFGAGTAWRYYAGELATREYGVTFAAGTVHCGSGAGVFYSNSADVIRR